MGPPEPTFSADLCATGVPRNGYHFACGDKADASAGVWPCTGSFHGLGGVEIMCSCACHRGKPAPFEVATPSR